MNPNDIQGTPAAEEKCATCGGTTSAGNCTVCGTDAAACTCPPAVPAMDGTPAATAPEATGEAAPAAEPAMGEEAPEATPAEGDAQPDMNAANTAPVDGEDDTNTGAPV